MSSAGNENENRRRMGELLCITAVSGKKLGALSLFLALEEFLLFQVGMYEHA